MRFGLSRWKAKYLLGSWIAYWMALLLLGLGSVMPAIWRISREGVKSSASVNFGDGGFTGSIMEGATTIWSGAISFRSLVLLFALPPLILWALWLFSQRRPPVPAETAAIGDGVESMSVDEKQRQPLRDDRLR